MSQHICKNEKCSTDAVEECSYCKGCKCSYGRLLTCKDLAEPGRKRCQRHMDKVGARMKKKYHDSHPNSRANLIATNERLQAEVDQFNSLKERVKAAKEQQRLAQESV